MCHWQLRKFGGRTIILVGTMLYQCISTGHVNLTAVRQVFSLFSPENSGSLEFPLVLSLFQDKESTQL
jgi:hypothetical protein